MSEFISILIKRISIIENFIRDLLLNQPDRIANHSLYESEKELLTFFIAKLQKEKAKPSVILNHYQINQPDFFNSLFNVLSKIVMDELFINKWFMTPTKEKVDFIYLRIRSALLSLWI